jgi:cytochrome c553
MKIKILWSLLALGLSNAAMVSVADAAGDREAGKTKFYTCVGCHGFSGYTNSYPNYNVPRLGGQHADYVVAALKAYQSNQRKHGSMHGNTASLSEQDMQDIAAYVSKFRSISVKLPTTGQVAAGQEKSQACQGCHGEEGNSTDPNFPRLAGQYESYLIKSLQDYKSGVRKNPIMGGFAAGLTEQDIKDISAFYASQARGLTIVED